MDLASTCVAVAVELAFRRARDGRRFGEASSAMQKELRK
jgi:hypothetical protein